MADSRPIALLIVGVTVGASAGLYVRTHDLLSPPSVRIENKRSAEADSRQTDLAHSSMLFAQPGSEECAELLSLAPREIGVVFRSDKNRILQRIGNRITAPETLKTIVEALCKD